MVTITVVTLVFICSAGLLFAEPMTSVRGYVLDHVGAPVKGASVEFTIRIESGGIVSYIASTTTTDSEGFYSIEYIAAGAGVGKADARCCGYDSKRIHLGIHGVNIIIFRLH